MYNREEMIKRIKQRKKELHYSNQKLSEKSEVPLGTLSKILGSETKDPQISSIIKISKALGVSADYIIFGNLFSENNNEFTKMFSCLIPEAKEKVMTYISDLIRAGDFDLELAEASTPFQFSTTIYVPAINEKNSISKYNK